MRLRAAWGAGVAMLAAAAIAGCGGSGGGGGRAPRDGAGGGGRGGARPPPWVRGRPRPLTGGASQLGQSVKKGYQAWEKSINEQGGILGRRVEMKIKDDGDNQNTAIADYNALISRDNVDFAFGTFSTRLALGAVEIVERNRMLYLDPAGAAPEMFARDSPLYFYTEPAAPWDFGTAYARYLAALPADQRPKSAAYVLTEDPFTRSTIGGMKPVLEAAGIRTVVEQTYPNGTQNFDPIASRVAQQQAEVVICAGDFNDEVGIIRSLIKAGARPRYLYQNNAPDEPVQFPAAVGRQNTQGVVSAAGYSPTFRTEGNAEFLRTYAELFRGEEPASLAAYAFGTGQILTAALEAVGEEGIDDQSKLADWLRDNAVETVSGRISWNERGEPLGDFATQQWQDGKQEMILPEGVATTDVVLNCWRTCTSDDRFALGSR